MIEPTEGMIQMVEDLVAKEFQEFDEYLMDFLKAIQHLSIMEDDFIGRPIREMMAKVEALKDIMDKTKIGSQDIGEYYRRQETRAILIQIVLKRLSAGIPE